MRFCFGVTCGHIARDKSAPQGGCPMQQVSARAKTLQGSGDSAQQVTIGISTMCLCQRSRVRRQHQRSPTRPHWQKISARHVLVAAPHVASFQPVEHQIFQPPREFPKKQLALLLGKSLITDGPLRLCAPTCASFPSVCQEGSEELAWHIICLLSRLRVIRSRCRSPSDEALQLVVEFFGENV